MDREIQNYINDQMRSSHKTLLDELNTLISSKLDKSEQNQRELSETQMAKMQQEFLAAGTYKFQRKSCEDQFKFNSKVTGKFKEVDSELDRGSLAGAKEKISEGMELIEHRQKLVRLADSSELGWKLVEEYVSHPLADGSDDEKRINRAFTAANRKVKAEKKKRKDRFRPYSPPAAAAAPGP